MRYVLPILAAAFVPCAAFAADGASFPWGEVIAALGSILVVLLTWGGKLLREWLKTKVKNEALAGVMSRAILEMERLVKYAEQAVRPTLAKALEDGKLSDAEKAELKRRVLEAFKSGLSWDDLVKVGFGGDEKRAEKHAEALLEAAVSELPKDPQ